MIGGPVSNPGECRGALVPSRRVLLVDENDDFLDGLASLMAKQPGMEVVGRAHLGVEAVERARSLSSDDLVLMDVSLRDMSGFEAVDLIKARPLAPKVLLMTFHESRAAANAAFASGADGCLSKSSMAGLSEVIERLVGPTSEEGAAADGTARGKVGITGTNGKQP